MSAPSLLHEHRVQLLASLADLATCTASARLDPGLLPDVVRADHRHRRLLVGDGKATETAGCAATARRLTRYSRASVPWARAGYTVRLVLCHDLHTDGWSGVLRRAAAAAGLQVVDSGTTTLDGASAVTWADLWRYSTS